MGIFSTIILIIIFYYCFKAVRSIWRDAFGGVGTNDHDSRSQRDAFNRRQQQDTHYNTDSTANTNKSDSPRVQQNEGEYVDFDET